MYRRQGWGLPTGMKWHFYFATSVSLLKLFAPEIVPHVKYLGESSTLFVGQETFLSCIMLLNGQIGNQ